MESILIFCINNLYFAIRTDIIDNITNNYNIEYDGDNSDKQLSIVRNEVVTIIDINKILFNSCNNSSCNNSLIVIKNKVQSFAFEVESIYKMAYIDRLNKYNVPKIVSSTKSFIEKYINYDNKLIGILNIDIIKNEF